VKITVQSENEIAAAAKAVLDAFPASRSFAFHGEMGAGKTTFIKAICTELGVQDGMSSPTFSLVNEYITNQGETIFHFDFYRIDNENDAYQAGLHEYFDTGNYCFVEWPEKVPSILPTGCVHVNIAVTNHVRTISIVS
jgi:tRNA threonylcarbamoyladenosine biosynthesis protein TsaE